MFQSNDLKAAIMSQAQPVAILVEDEPQIRRFVRAALDAGADDYLSKPFGVGELLARVRASLRRQHQPLAYADAMIRFGVVALDQQARIVTKAQQPVHLTPTEYRLLTVLVANAGRVVTNPQLLREVWGPSHSESGHY